MSGARGAEPSCSPSSPSSLPARAGWLSVFFCQPNILRWGGIRPWSWGAAQEGRRSPWASRGSLPPGLRLSSAPASSPFCSALALLRPGPAAGTVGRRPSGCSRPSLRSPESWGTHELALVPPRPRALGRRPAALHGLYLVGLDLGWEHKRRHRRRSCDVSALAASPSRLRGMADRKSVGRERV